jgi:hypothetical protein
MQIFWDASNKLNTIDPFDLSTYFPQIEALDWSDAVAEPEGWAHLPGAALCQQSPYAETPLIRLRTVEHRRRFGQELDKVDPF